MTSVTEALETDITLSLSQLRRHYGLTTEKARALRLLTHMPKVGRTKQSVGHPIRFFLLSKYRRYANLKGHDIRHLAGMAEMRHFLKAKTQEWSTRDLGTPKGGLPDAEWQYRHERAAIEFDAGSYDRAKLTAKAEAFSRYDEQIWGAATKQRVTYLREHFAQTDIRVLVILACWY